MFSDECCDTYLTFFVRSNLGPLKNNFQINFNVKNVVAGTKCSIVL